MPRVYTTIIVTDSRGRGIDEYIGANPTPDDQRYVFHVKPGKTIAQLAPTIIDAINSHDIDYVYCIVSAGICGFTDKSIDKSMSPRASVLRYQDTYRSDKLRSNIDTATFLKNRYGNHINICSIIPADLTAYFRFHNPGLPVPDYLTSEQKALEEDVLTFNKALLELNSPDTTNINLSSRAQVKSKKKRQRSGAKIVYRRVVKFSYKGLTDGVHYSTKLKDTIFGLILHTSIRDTIKILRTPEDLSSLTDSD